MLQPVSKHHNHEVSSEKNEHEHVERSPGNRYEKRRSIVEIFKKFIDLRGFSGAVLNDKVNGDPQHLPPGDSVVS